MSKILSHNERMRNERLKELYRQRQEMKSSQNRDMTPQIKKLTPAQMSEVNDLRRDGYSREEAVKIVLSKTS